ncbi:MAG: mechanosensitive ion channel family protein [Defluviitaleaceae bacterium]|nr:mechanosensitive ion channel family protein [Defluviitaleaceae bacterium]
MENIEMFIWDGLINVGYAVLIVVGGLILSRIVRSAIRRAFAKVPGNEQRTHRNTTISRLLIDILKYVTYFAVIIAVLYVFFGTTIQSFLAVAGVGGIAIGFGAQNLIRDLISGFFLILDGQLAIGDDVTIGGVKGIVEDIGLRATRIRCEDNGLTIIPNGEIKIIVNRSR